MIVSFWLECDCVQPTTHAEVGKVSRGRMGSVKGSARSGIWDLVVQWVLVAVQWTLARDRRG